VEICDAPQGSQRVGKITEERARTEEAIKRARRNKQRVAGLYDYAKTLTNEAHRWEQYFK
jgi:hypothetical protein